MTVIATVITKHCTAHASDSFLTIKQPDGTYKVVEDQKTKIARVETWCGAIAYWGLATLGNNRQPTIEWLQERGREASRFKSAEAFAVYLTGKLNEAIAMIPPDQRGIGLHLTVYEEVSRGCRVPELFRISNYKDTNYNTIYARVRLTRETYNVIRRVPTEKRHGQIAYRLKVHHELHHKNAMLVYNNGDTHMFNPILAAILELLRQVNSSGNLVEPDNLETYRAIARMPIEIVTKAQDKFARKGKRLVGGTIHDLVVTEDGQYSSTVATS